MKFCIGYLNETWLKDKKEKNLDLLPILICGTHLQCGLKKKKVHRNKYHQNQHDRHLHCVRWEHLFIKNNTKPRMSVLSVVHLHTLGMQDVA